MDQQQLSRLDASRSLAAYSLSNPSSSQTAAPSSMAASNSAPNAAANNLLNPLSGNGGQFVPNNASNSTSNSANYDMSTDPRSLPPDSHASPSAPHPTEVNALQLTGAPHFPSAAAKALAALISMPQQTADAPAPDPSSSVEGETASTTKSSLNHQEADNTNTFHDDAARRNGQESPAAQPSSSADDQGQGSAGSSKWESSNEGPPPGIPRKIEEELRAIYAAATSIANFTAAHINQGYIPRAADLQNSVNRSLNITQGLTYLLSDPEVVSPIKGRHNPSTPGQGAAWDLLPTISGYDSSTFSGKKGANKQGSARKRRRSADWKDEGNPDYASQSQKDRVASATLHSRSQSFTGDEPQTLGSNKYDTEGFLASFPSPLGGEGSDQKGPQYKKRSRAPAPGSCQACSTSETPEWRRGPDGARTLCNACGLHYAKLCRNKKRQLEQEGAPASAQVIVTIEELRASTKANDIGGPPSNGTPMKGPKTPAATPLESTKSELEDQQHHHHQHHQDMPPVDPAIVAAATAAAERIPVEARPPPPAPAPTHDSVEQMQPHFAPTPAAPWTKHDASLCRQTEKM